MAKEDESRYDIIISVIVEQFEKSNKSLKDINKGLKNLVASNKKAEVQTKKLSERFEEQCNSIKKISSKITGLCRTIATSYVPRMKQLIAPILRFNLLAPKSAESVYKLQEALNSLKTERFISLAGAAETFANIGSKSFTALFSHTVKYRKEMVRMTNAMTATLGPKKGGEIVEQFFGAFENNIYGLKVVMKAFREGELKGTWRDFEELAKAAGASSGAVTSISGAFKDKLHPAARTIKNVNELMAIFKMELDDLVASIAGDNVKKIKEILDSIKLGIKTFFDFIKKNKETIITVFKAIAEVVKFVAQGIVWLSKQFMSLSASTRKSVLAIGLLTVTFHKLIGLKTGLKFLIGAVRLLSTSLAAISLTPVGLAVVGIAAATYGAYKLYQHVNKRDRELAEGGASDAKKRRHLAYQRSQEAATTAAKAAFGDERGIEARVAIAGELKGVAQKAAQEARKKFKEEQDISDYVAAIMKPQVEKKLRERIDADVGSLYKDKALMEVAPGMYGNIMERIVSGAVAGKGAPGEEGIKSFDVAVENAKKMMEYQKEIATIMGTQAELMRLTGQEDKRLAESSKEVLERMKETRVAREKSLKILKKIIDSTKDEEAKKEKLIVYAKKRAELAEIELGMAKLRVEVVKQQTAQQESLLSLAEAEEKIYRTQLSMMEAVYGTPALAVQAMTRIIKMLEIEKDRLQEIYETRRRARMEAEEGTKKHAELRRMELKSADDLQKKELERLQLVKKLRDGYIDAVQAAAYGAGALNKLLITREQNVGLGQRLGAVRRNFLIGMTQEPGAKQVGAYRFGQFGGFERPGGGAFGARELAGRQRTIGERTIGFQREWFNVGKELSQGTLALSQKTSNSISAVLANTGALLQNTKTQQTIASMGGARPIPGGGRGGGKGRGGGFNDDVEKASSDFLNTAHRLINIIADKLPKPIDLSTPQSTSSTTASGSTP